MSGTAGLGSAALAPSAQSAGVKEGRKEGGPFSVHAISGCWSKLHTHVSNLDLLLGEACFKQCAGGYSSTRRRRRGKSRRSECGVAGKALPRPGGRKDSGDTNLYCSTLAWAATRCSQGIRTLFLPGTVTCSDLARLIMGKRDGWHEVISRGRFSSDRQRRGRKGRGGCLWQNEDEK